MFDKAVLRVLCRIERKLDLVIALGELIMATLDEQLTALAVQVTAESDAEDAAIKAFNGTIDALKAQIVAALAGTITPAQQAKIDAITASAKANSDKMAAAVVANTPPVAGPVVPAGTAAPVTP